MSTGKLSKLEVDRFLSYIGATYSDIQIWGQYDRLVDFIFNEFPKTGNRFDLISHPTLFVLSHGLELGIKENIKILRQYSKSKHLTKFESWSELIKSHDLTDLAKEYKIIYYRLLSEVKDNTLKSEFDKYYKYLDELISILDRGAETYRYALKIDNTGKEIKRAIDKLKTIDLLKVKELFEKVKILLIAAPNTIGIYTDYIDFIKGNPDYKKGRGYLLTQKIWHDDVTLKQMTDALNENFKRIGNNHWLDTDSGENYEIQVWSGDIYIIAFDPTKI